ncbi:MAG: hypothetical protein V1875_04370 [Candidatus Altiarchaeota archaeon]
MDKKSYEPPQNIEDLMRVYYGPAMGGEKVSSDEINRYGDFIRTRVISPHLERLVGKLLAPFGELVRVKENRQNKVPDFEIKDKRIQVEITSINTSVKKNVCGSRLPLNLPKNEADTIPKVNRCIDHISLKKGEKDSNHQLWGIIFYDCILATLKKFYVLISEKNTITKTKFKNSNLDALFFICRPSSISGVSSEELYPPMIYVKNKHLASQLSRITEATIVEVGA